jgi:hypothetical protein
MDTGLAGVGVMPVCSLILRTTARRYSQSRKADTNAVSTALAITTAGNAPVNATVMFISEPHGADRTGHNILRRRSISYARRSS